MPKSVLLAHTVMTEAEIKSGSSLFKRVFKLILFVSSILFLSVTASWLVTKRLTSGPTVVEKGQYEKYVWKVTSLSSH